MTATSRVAAQLRLLGKAAPLPRHRIALGGGASREICRTCGRRVAIVVIQTRYGDVSFLRHVGPKT